MADNPDMNVWQIVLGTAASFLGGLGLYQSKKISELSEKYVLKTDYTEYKSDMKEDFTRLEDGMKEDFIRLEDGMKKEFSYLYNLLERCHSSRKTDGENNGK